MAGSPSAFSRIELDGESRLIESPDADRIRFISRWGCVIGMADVQDGCYAYRTRDDVVTGRLPANHRPLSVRYPFHGEERYVRCEAVGRGGRTAWTQPVWID